MKKLRLIVTSVTVLAIVGGAFAFKIKAGSFCVREDASAGDDCTTYIQNVKITTSILHAKFRYNHLWDGTKTLCTQAGNGNCFWGPIRLENN